MISSSVKSISYWVWWGPGGLVTQQLSQLWITSACPRPRGIRIIIGEIQSLQDGLLSLKVSVMFIVSPVCSIQHLGGKHHLGKWQRSRPIFPHNLQVYTTENWKFSVETRIHHVPWWAALTFDQAFFPVIEMYHYHIGTGFSTNSLCSFWNGCCNFPNTAMTTFPKSSSFQSLATSFWLFWNGCCGISLHLSTAIQITE